MIHAVRRIGGLVIIYAASTETGLWTTVALALLFGTTEAAAWMIRIMLKRIKRLEAK